MSFPSSPQACQPFFLKIGILQYSKCFHSHPEYIIKISPKKFVRELDFGASRFGFVYATAEDGELTAEPFHTSIDGAEGVGTSTKSNGESLKCEDDAMPHETGSQPGMKESLVIEGTMQLNDLIREGRPSIVQTNQARHVIEFIEAGYRACTTGKIMNSSRASNHRLSRPSDKPIWPYPGRWISSIPIQTHG